MLHEVHTFRLGLAETAEAGKVEDALVAVALAAAKEAVGKAEAATVAATAVVETALETWSSPVSRAPDRSTSLRARLRR